MLGLGGALGFLAVEGGLEGVDLGDAQLLPQLDARGRLFGFVQVEAAVLEADLGI